MPNKYTKKPVTVEAVQWTGDNLDEVNDFVGLSYEGLRSYRRGEEENIVAVSRTAEEVYYAHINDWILKDSNGHFSVCKPDIFAETYEEGSDD